MPVSGHAGVHSWGRRPRLPDQALRNVSVRIVLFGVVLARQLDVFRRVDQMPVGDHRMMRRPIELSSAMVLGRALVMPRRMLQQLRGFQMVIDALLRHVPPLDPSPRLTRD